MLDLDVYQGKTMLLKAILGELSLKGGNYVPPSSSIAYAAQDAFIFPGCVFFLTWNTIHS